MSEQGWYPDPFGRYEARWYDGSEWTGHVSTGGEQRVDPLGTTASVPFTTPETAAAQAWTPPPAAPGANPVRAFLDGLGTEARERPAPKLGLALAGAGGAVAAVGIAALIGGDELGRGQLATAGVLIVAAAIAVRLLLAGPPEPRAAAVGAGAVGIFAIGAAIAGDDLDSAAAALAIIGLLYVAAWILPGLRGRPLLLGLGALALVFALAGAVSSAEGDGLDSLTGVVSDQYALLLIGGAVLLGLVVVLDRQGYHGVGTSLVVAGVVAALIGAFGTVSSLGETGGSALLTAVGAVVAFVGSHGERRATTWYGAALATAGVVTLVVNAMKPEDPTAIGTALLVSGIVLIAVPFAVRAVKATAAGKPAAGPPSAEPPVPGGQALPPPTA